MASSATRSCFTCQKRRRKCDREQPRCQSCIRDGKDCEGYDQAMTFVNFDSGNIKSRKKKVYSQAVLEHRNERSDSASLFDHEALITYFDAGLAAADPTRCLYAISIPDLLEEDFRKHAFELHGQFMKEHSLTTGACQAQMQKLHHQSRTFDLAVLALSCLRLSQTSDNASLQTVCLTAYGKSMSIFRAQCGKIIADHDVSVPPIMTLICLLYCLFEFMLHTPATILQSGLIDANPHVDGAVVLMQKSGPSAFATGGHHLTFKKMRELAILSAISKRKVSFLASENWLTAPWAVRSKTYRDRVYDCAARATLIFGKSHSSNSRTLVHQIRQDLTEYEATWLATKSTAHTAILLEYPAIQYPQIMSCRDARVYLLKLETEAIHFLLLLMELEHILEHDEGKCQVDEFWTALDKKKGEIQRALTSPIFRFRPHRKQGIVEAHTRTLLPMWLLREYERISRRITSLPPF